MEPKDALRKWLLRASILTALVFTSLVLMVATVVAAPLFSRSSLDEDATVITFDGLPGNTLITNQFAPQGVTFSGQIRTSNITFSTFWPGSSVPIAAHLTAFTDVTATFSSAATQVGFEVISNERDFVELQAYCKGVLVDSFDFDTHRRFAQQADFIGLDVSDGFDTLVIHGHGPVNGAWLLDDFSFVADDDDDEDDDDDDDDEGCEVPDEDDEEDEEEEEDD